MFNQNWGIVGGDAEGNGGADVAKYGVTYSVGHLGDVLVSDGEIEPVFARFGQNNGERIGGKVLELINVEIEGATVGDIGYIGATHGGKLNFGDKESPKDTGVIFADEPFREIDNQNFALVHDFANIERRLGLADDIADDRVSGKGTNFIENWGDRLIDLLVVPLTKFVFPELKDGHIFAIIESFATEIFVGEHARNV